ncbi:MAG: CPBP family intramembrane metalloprotease [Saprospiraceae bacterium]|nr:CPBP family intramembrane metalloprotease [Saprospiraceae bacterium]
MRKGWIESFFGYLRRRMISQFFSAAQLGKNDWWRYLVGFLLVFMGIAVIGYIPMLIVIFLKVFRGEIDDTDLQYFLNSLDFQFVQIGNNFGIFLLLLSFLISLLILIWVLKTFHHRSIRTVIHGMESIRWGRIGFAFALWFGFSVITEVISYTLDPDLYQFQFDLKTFLPLLIISLTLIPIQTSFEELLFRGYLLQGLALSGMKLIWPLILTSIGFGLMHGMNPEVQEFGAGKMMIYYIGSGILLGVLTIMDDGLELALGTHAATNFFAATCVTFESAALKTDALFKVTEINLDLTLIGFIILSSLFILICSWKYKWTHWSRLLEPAKFSNQNSQIEGNEIA